MKVACKDKERRIRVSASGNLPRNIYYCPNPKCNALLTLVDCDEEIRSDHFRLKPGSSHIKNCEFATIVHTKEGNNFTDIEYEILSKSLNATKKKITKIGNLLETYKNNKSLIDPMIQKIINVWINYDITNEREILVVSNNFYELKYYINKITEDKFKFAKKTKSNVIASCIPFTFFKIALYDDFFINTENNFLKQQGTIVHEIAHQIFWMNDRGGYGKDAKKKKPWKKQRNADNWSSCYEEIVTYIGEDSL